MVFFDRDGLCLFTTASKKLAPVCFFSFEHFYLLMPFQEQDDYDRLEGESSDEDVSEMQANLDEDRSALEEASQKAAAAEASAPKPAEPEDVDMPEAGKTYILLIT